MVRLRVAAFSQVIYCGEHLRAGDEIEVSDDAVANFLRSGNFVPADGDWHGVVIDTAPQPPKAKPPAPNDCPCDPGAKPAKGARIAVCGVVGCGCQTWHIKGRADRCRAHRRSSAEGRQYRDTHKSSGAAGRRTAWAKLRARILIERPLCESEKCSALPAIIRPAAQEVDHIKGGGLEGPLWNHPDFLAALCKPCHSAKTARESFGN